MSQLFSPGTPFDVHPLIPSNPESVFNPHLGRVKETSSDFSSVDLSFLDELTQENKDQPVIENKHETEKSCKTQKNQQSQLPLPGEEDSVLSWDLHSSPDSHVHLHPDGADSNQPSPEKPNLDALPVASIVSMIPKNPVPESSGIMPQLQ
ncbi:TATA box-binding 2 [Sigmodon hispidus]